MSLDRTVRIYCRSSLFSTVFASCLGKTVDERTTGIILEERLNMSHSEEVEETGRTVAVLQD
jgi:hypothetical protein